MSDPNMDKLRQEEEARIAVRIASIPKLEARIDKLEHRLPIVNATVDDLVGCIKGDLAVRVDELASDMAALNLLYQSQSRHLFEMCNSIDGLEARLDKLEKPNE